VVTTSLAGSSGLDAYPVTRPVPSTSTTPNREASSRSTFVVTIVTPAPDPVWWSRTSP